MIADIRRTYTGMAFLFAAGLMVGGGSASAADLGGNCCADLEERVADLEATTARKGNRRVSLTISGEVSTALMAWDDGNKSDLYIVDNTVSRSSFGFDGEAKITPNLKAGFEIVIGIATGARSHMVNQKDDDATGVTKLTTGDQEEAEGVISLELANWYLEHKHLGKLAVGRVETASDGTSTVDLGGAGVIANAEIGEWQQGFFLSRGDYTLKTTWEGIFGGSSVSRSGFAHGNAIVYTTPNLHGFSFSASWGENDVWDAALRYAAEWHGFRVAAAIAFTHNHGNTDEVTPENSKGPEPTKWQGSASILHVASGLYLTTAYVNQDNDQKYYYDGWQSRPDTTLWYIQAGIGRNWTGLGKTVFYGEYARVEDGLSGTFLKSCYGEGCLDLITGSEVTVWGIGVVQHIDSAAMELFLAYRRYAAEVTSPDTQYGSIHGTESLNDFDVLMTGARIRF